ncbi:MAG: ATP-binding protein, partial [Pseudomonadales bacterium]|nr:ATP-binding protein [Pseudomonadales bacterium]
MNSAEPGRSSGVFVRRVDVPFKRTAIESIQAEVTLELTSRGYDESAAFAIRLAIEEALVNGFRHGNAGDTGKTVQFECEIDNDSVRIEIVDQGSGFNPGSVPDPTDEANLETPSGRGIMLMRAYMTEVEYVAP